MLVQETAPRIGGVPVEKRAESVTVATSLLHNNVHKFYIDTNCVNVSVRHIKTVACSSY